MRKVSREEMLDVIVNKDVEILIDSPEELYDLLYEMADRRDDTEIEEQYDLVMGNDNRENDYE